MATDTAAKTAFPQRPLDNILNFRDIGATVNVVLWSKEGEVSHTQPLAYIGHLTAYSLLVYEGSCTRDVCIEVRVYVVLLGKHIR